MAGAASPPYSRGKGHHWPATWHPGPGRKPASGKGQVPRDLAHKSQDHLVPGQMETLALLGLNACHCIIFHAHGRRTIRVSETEKYIIYHVFFSEN